MLHVFYLDVAYVSQCVFKRFQVFLRVFLTYVATISKVGYKCFIWMFEN
jgi:hypothetical protein